MFLFIDVFGLPAHLHDVLVVHLNQMVQQHLAGFHQEAEHQRVAFVLMEPFEIGSAVASGQFEEVIQKSGCQQLGLRRIDARIGNGSIALQ